MGKKKVDTSAMYFPGGFPPWMEKAFATNASRDASDHKAGFAAPGDNGIASLLRNAISAISCGYQCKSWDEVAEGLAMICQAELAARKAEEP